jgi:hypothetical protein
MALLEFHLDGLDQSKAGFYRPITADRVRGLIADGERVEFAEGVGYVVYDHEAKRLFDEQQTKRIHTEAWRAFCRRFIREQSEGKWDEKMINLNAEKLLAEIKRGYRELGPMGLGS